MKKEWLKKIQKASKLESEADKLLNDVLSAILNDKGIDTEGFFVCRASGNETVVHHNTDEGCKTGLSDLDLTVIAGMTKKEILDYFGI